MSSITHNSVFHLTRHFHEIYESDEIISTLTIQNHRTYILLYIRIDLTNTITRDWQTPTRVTPIQRRDLIRNIESRFAIEKPWMETNGTGESERSNSRNASSRISFSTITRKRLNILYACIISAGEIATRSNICSIARRTPKG